MSGRPSPGRAGLHNPAAMLSRKRFLAVAGVSAGALAAGCGGEDEAEREREARVAADREIVRFLLRVEQITTAFWDQAASRSALTGTPAADLTADIARNEREHVGTLERYARRLSGGEPPAPPTTTFAEVFAAGPEEVLGTGATLTNLSAAAHLGQLNRVQDRNLLASVLAIHTVDARMAAATNRLAGRGFALGNGSLEGALPDGAFAEPMTMREVDGKLRRYAP